MRVLMAVCAALFLALLFLLGASVSPSAGSDSQLRKQLGKNCVVQFRRGDALGSAGELPVSVATDVVNGAVVSIAGTLTSASTEWITIENRQDTYLIPTEGILLLRFPSDHVQTEHSVHGDQSGAHGSSSHEGHQAH